MNASHFLYQPSNDQFEQVLVIVVLIPFCILYKVSFEPLRTEKIATFTKQGKS